MEYNVGFMHYIKELKKNWQCIIGADINHQGLRRLCGFQLAQLVKFLVVEQETWVQIPPTPKINWCLGLMVRATIMSGRHRFKFYHNYQKMILLYQPAYVSNLNDI